MFVFFYCVFVTCKDTYVHINRKKKPPGNHFINTIWATGDRDLLNSGGNREKAQGDYSTSLFQVLYV